MAHEFVVALGIAIATSPVPANPERAPATAAPMESADARYCLRVAPATGSLVETVRCWTRQQWVEQGVDVDKEWAKEGVGIKR